MGKVTSFVSLEGGKWRLLSFFKVFFYFAICKSEILQAGLWASHVIAESRYGLIINLKY